MSTSAELSPVGRWILSTIRLLADHPDKVVVREVVGDHSTIFEVEVDKSDIGRVVGRQWIYRDLIKDLLKPMAGKQRRRFRLEIIE